MRPRINLWQDLQQLCDAFTSCHLVIILRACYGFQCNDVAVAAFEALPLNRKVPRPMPIRISIGTALEFKSARNDRSGWSQIAACVESSVRTLAAQSRAA